MPDKATKRQKKGLSTLTIVNIGLVLAAVAAITVYVIASQPDPNKPVSFVIAAQDKAMLPQYKPGDRVEVRPRPNYQPGDIVAITDPSEPINKQLRRIVAVGGQRIEIRAGVVSINGQVLDEPYITPFSQNSLEPLTVPAGFVFLLGDNRPASQDSRDYGPVRADLILGAITK